MKSMGERVLRWCSRLRDRITGGGDSSFSDSRNPLHSPSSSDYTELMGGSVPCPSCKGSGRIPVEMERTLVALIPLSDDRLKPRRTCLWVLFGVLVCSLLAGTAIYLLVPRSIQLVSIRPPIENIHVTGHSAEQKFINFDFINSINISNANFYSVKVANSSATIISRFRPYSTDVLGHGENVSSVIIPALSSNTRLTFNNSVSLTKDASDYCQSAYAHLTSLYILMQFDITVTVSYFSHYEQVTLSTQQQVCCIPNGNCTQSL